jgi:hypothetical protein
LIVRAVIFGCLTRLEASARTAAAARYGKPSNGYILNVKQL